MVETKLKVTQADRDAAADHLALMGDAGFANAVRYGDSDDYHLVQAFARHRLSSQPLPTGEVREIKTWEQRCDEHPDHEGLVTTFMIQMRMQEEIDDLRTALQSRSDAVASLEAQSDKLVEAMQQALACTPSIKVASVTRGLARHVIQYDCGDPWEILSQALTEYEGARHNG